MNADMHPLFHPGDSVIDEVRSRIHYKMRDYDSYRFSGPQSCAINIFFDLAQEFDDLEHIQLLCVFILHMFFGYDAELYLRREDDELGLVTPAISSDSAGVPLFRGDIWQDSVRCYIPVRGKCAPVVTEDRRIIAGEDLMGVLVIYTARVFAEHDLLFLEKYANRVGFSLHNRILALRNERHVLFLRKIAHDIGHNIITPNMRLKLLLHQFSSQIATLGILTEQPPDEAHLHDLRVLQKKMEEHAKAITDNFTNSALFLESLLRQSHFDLGHYVLRLERLDLVNRVVTPQFERYRSHFDERELFAAAPDFPEGPCMVQADLGLLSQVLANFLSNATKYTRALPGGRAEVRCSVTRDENAFGRGGAGYRVSVFSSGPAVNKEEREHLFNDNYRASNSSGQFGTGHGLFFVREIIAEHRGIVGYETAPGGNVFYFTLPEAQ